MHPVMWWLIPLLLFLILRGNHRRRHPRGGRLHGERAERELAAELRRTVEDQRGSIEALESRLARVEDGLEFAERLLADRGASASRA